MSDMMERPTEEVMEQQRSIYNPTDAAAMVKQGKIGPDMSVEQYLMNVGIDPKGPVTQLVSFAKRQMQKANPMNKMQALANSQPKGPAAPPQGGPAPQGPPGGGISDLLKNMK